MKNTKKKLSMMLSIALGVTLLTPTAALAADLLDSTPVEAVPISIPIEPISDTINKQADFLGGNATVVEVLEDKIVVSLQHSVEENPQNYVLNISEETFFVDNETGAASSIKDIQVDDSLYVYHSLVSTRSIPAQTAAYVILTNVKEDATIGTLLNVDTIKEREDAISIPTKDGSAFIHFSKDTNVLPYATRNMLSYKDIQQGQRVLAWYDVMALSFPAQANAVRAVVLPAPVSTEEVIDATPIIVNQELNMTFAELARAIVTQIAGEQPTIMDTHYATPYMLKLKDLGLITDEQYANKEAWNKKITTDDMNAFLALLSENDITIDTNAINALIINEIVVNGTTLTATATLENGTIMVPVRAVAEALGFTLTWDGTTRSADIFNEEITSTVQLGYNNYFTESIATSTMLETQELSIAPRLVDSSTYVPVEYFNLLLGSSDAVEIADHVLTITK